MYKHNRAVKQNAYLSSLEKAVAGDIHPLQTCFFLTGNCNLNCTYCAQKNSLSKTDIDLKEWKRASDIAYGLGNRMISIVGGEPLLSPYLLDLVNYISDRDTTVSVLTNGRSLEKSLLHSLDEAGLDNLGFSIDTLETGQQPLFGKTLTKKLEHILRYIRDSHFSFRTSVAAVITKYNLDIQPEMLRTFTELGLPLRVSLMVRGVVNHGYTEDIALREEDLPQVERVFEKLWKMKSEGYLLGNEDCFFTSLKPQMGCCTPAGVYQMYMGNDSRYTCEGGIHYLAVLNNGMLESCTTGVPSETHIEMLTSVEDYRAFVEENRKKTDQCKGCPWPHRWVLTHLKETGGYNHYRI